MASLKELQRRLKKISLDNLQSEVKDIVISDKTIYDAKMFEFERGLKPNDDIIGIYRDVDYAVFKEQQNPLANGNVDLILTGSFTSQLYLRYLGNGRFSFDSRDGKAPMLFEKYGDSLRSVNPETWNDLQKQEYAPKLIKYIKRITGL